MIRGSITNPTEDEILKGKLPGNVNYGIQGPSGPKGSDGGYYIPDVKQIDRKTAEINFTPSDEGMPSVNPAQIELPINESSGGNVDLTGYATEQWVQDQKYLTEVPEGYAKTKDIPTKPEDIGALPNTYTPPNQTAEQVGADPKGTAATAVSQHNTADDSHNDIRLELKAINDRLTAFFDSDDQTLDELSEIVAYITSNKSLIDSITTSKVSVADIINNLTTNVSNKPLSAAQGVVLKGLIDTVSGNLANYQPKGDYALRSEVPTVPTKVSAFTNDAGYLTEHQDISGLAEKFKPTAYGLPILNLTGDITGMNKDNAVSLSYVYGERTGSCTLKWQGNSSLAYDKKNYTIKFDTAFEAVEGWGAQKKYCLKANYIDFSHARNVVNAKLWGQIVKARATPNVTLNALPNCGAVDGFPVMVVINGEYTGLYTFNIPKDGWMYGMGSGTKEAILCADAMTPATLFNANATLNGDFELEYVTDENNADWVLTSLNTLINAVKNNNNANFKTAVSPYLDLDSAIDYYIFTVLLRGYDMVGKNYILHTYDGTKWAFGAYDMDCTYGLEWDGSAFMTANTGTTFTSYASNHILMSRLKKYMADKIKARYDELRNSVMSEDNVVTTFANFIGKIPKAVYDEECKVWTMLPNTATNNLSQIQDWYRRRCIAIDAEVADIFAETEPSGPVNLVETATDTDGSIYNGAGYKDGWRFKSSSGEEAAQTGSVITGYIPCQEGDKFKVSGVEWGTNTAMGFYTVCGLWNAAHAYVGGNSGNDPSNTYVQRLTAEETGDGFIFQVTEPCAFIRFSMKGSGANMVVTKIE